MVCDHLPVGGGKSKLKLVRFPPGVDLPSSPDDDPRVVDYRELSNRIKKQFLKDRKYWYLNIIARHPERKEPAKSLLALLQLERSGTDLYRCCSCSL